MPEAFLALSATDKAEALQLASQASGRPMHVLEKDAWVVWALEVLFNSDFRDSLVFKGGTSLSMAYQIIQRFSEDVDVTYDIRSLVPEMAAESPNALPSNRSQEKRWTKAIRERLPQWVDSAISPLFAAAIASQNLQAQLRLDGEKLFLKYNPASAGSGYIAPVVLVEFGARSTGDPCSPRPVSCDAAPPPADPRLPLSHAPRDAPGAHLLGESHCHPRLLRSGRVSRRPALCPPLVRPRSSLPHWLRRIGLHPADQ